MPQSRRILLASSFIALLIASGVRATAHPVFQRDFEPGSIPTQAEIEKVEADVRAKPDDFLLARRLGKGYFFQYFGENRESAAPKARKAFERALELKKNDPEMIAYLGMVAALVATRSKDEAERKSNGMQALEWFKKAEQIDPDSQAVLLLSGTAYTYMADSFGTAPQAIKRLERFCELSKEFFSHMSHHGQQRVLITLGEAYVKAGEVDKAKAVFEKALVVNPESAEGLMAKGKLDKLKPQH